MVRETDHTVKLRPEYARAHGDVGLQEGLAAQLHYRQRSGAARGLVTQQAGSTRDQIAPKPLAGRYGADAMLDACSRY